MGPCVIGVEIADGARAAYPAAVRPWAGLLSLASFGVVAWALSMRVWIGFPDGFRGEADHILDPVLLALAIGGAAVGLVAGTLAVRPASARSLVALTVVWVVLAGASLAAEPLVRAWFPSGGG